MRLVKSSRPSSIGTSSPVLDEIEEGFPKMRCVDVIRELAAPTDTRDAVGLTDHLSRCSSCANWARQAEQLDRLWDLTRPSEPSPEVWDSLWSQVAHSLDNPTAQEVASPTPSVSWDHSTDSSLLVLGGETRPAFCRLGVPCPILAIDWLGWACTGRCRPSGCGIELVAVCAIKATGCYIESGRLESNSPDRGRCFLAQR